MSDIINWIKNPIWILAGHSLASGGRIDDYAGNYLIETGELKLSLSRSQKEDIILKFSPYRSFRSDFSELSLEYKQEGDVEYFSKFTCRECKVSDSYDWEDRSGLESNDWTKIVTQIASHFGHTWTFFAEIEDQNAEGHYILYMDGRVA